MIAGIGVDMIEVERIASKVAKESGFREYVFSKGEIDYCETKINKYEHYAARFAAKEAFFKALGTGWSKGTSFNEIELTHNEQGGPEILLLGETANFADSLGVHKILVSISHLKSLAAAFVILEK